ncbi:MAG: type I-U CRISPR-associated protein Cas7 [Sandaracinaceae bacterium]|nr:type I-U CRISPR-associated protein Cas7 [Sandaracinaceae bacterium]
MTTPAKLTLAALRDAVHGGAVAIRAVTRLESAGGPGDKVFPPTYVKEGRSQTKYAMEERIVDGRRVPTVLLDSVASQANRTEEALLEGWRRGELKFPVVSVDFSQVEGLADLEQITSLQAPHRIADALLRDSVDDDGTPFRQTIIGKEFTDSRPNHATGMYKHCPTALVFGVWDSTGPKGGMGAKFQRCLVSEIVGYDVVTGVKTASRIDPAGIEKKAGPIYELKGSPGEWTSLESEAATEKKDKPVLFSRKGAGDKGSPATINHGNIPPSIDSEAGGVTMSHAVQTVVLSLAGLRRLRFQMGVDGTPIPPGDRDAAETAARTALAALALAGVVYQRRRGYDLRSRSLLVASEPLVFEVLGRDGGPPIPYVVEDAAELLSSAEAAARQLGLGWSSEAISLKPTPKLSHLIIKSRELTAAGDLEEPS